MKTEDWKYPVSILIWSVGLFLIIIGITGILTLIIIEPKDSEIDRLEQRFKSGQIDSISVGDNGTVCVEYLETKCVSR